MSTGSPEGGYHSWSRDGKSQWNKGIGDIRFDKLKKKYMNTEQESNQIWNPENGPWKNVYDRLYGNVGFTLRIKKILYTVTYTDASVGIRFLFRVRFLVKKK